MNIIDTHVLSGYVIYRRALTYLVSQGLMKRANTRRTSLDVAITKLGKERIHGLLPMYREDRPWDGHMYLLSYDIPTIANKKRDLLREYLRRIGAVILQESLWLTPYNPRDIVDDFVHAHEIGGSILVSKLGTDGAIGEEKLEELIARVYRLDALNGRYETFLGTHGNRRKNLVKFQISLAYYAILKDDPQLPFALLPRDFLGAKAYTLYRSLMIK